MLKKAAQHIFISCSVLAIAFLGAGVSEASDNTFGAPLDESVPAVSLEKISGDGDSYVGQSVRVAARVSQVCQKKGCFFIAQQGDSIMRVSFKDYGFFVPTDISGKHVTFVGEVVARDMTEDEAAHFAEELGPDAEPMAPGKVYEIVASSVRIPAG